jgi:hypothetical protein
VLGSGRGASAEPERARFGASAGVGVGFYQFEGVGPWLELGGVARIPLGPSWYVSGGVTLDYNRNQKTKHTLDFDGDGDADPNTDEVELFGVFTRAVLGLRLSPVWSVEAGGFVGLAHTTLSSEQCGSSSDTDLGLGGSIGPALRLGEREQWAMALHAEAFWVPFQRCTNGGGADPFVFAPFVHGQDDAQVAAVLRVQYFF